MSVANIVCIKFLKILNDELATGQQVDHITIDALKQRPLSESTKHDLGAPIEANLTLLDLTKQSVDLLCKLRLIYLFSLLEAFGKEYIAARDSLELDVVAASLGPEKSDWQKEESGIHGTSSLLNMRFLRFVLGRRYGVHPSQEISPVFWEAGVLRNSLVHDQAVVGSEFHRSALQETIALTGSENRIGARLRITEALVWQFLKDARRLITDCFVR